MNRTHAILDALSREAKARKIEVLTKIFGASDYRRVLEVGTGAGYIASYFGNCLEMVVTAVDVADERQVMEGYDFVQVESTALPFDPCSFDLAITNHVIEHVGQREAQIKHLQEIYRCLKPGGVLYFAVPNRWRLVEAHYQLPLLSWLPAGLADKYIRAIRGIERYDCTPLSNGEVRQILRQTGFEYVDATLDAIAVMKEIEGKGGAGYLMGLPKWCWWPVKPIIPTFIFICRKPMQ